MFCRSEDFLFRLGQILCNYKQQVSVQVWSSYASSTIQPSLFSAFHFHFTIILISSFLNNCCLSKLLPGYADAIFAIQKHIESNKCVNFVLFFYPFTAILIRLLCYLSGWEINSRQMLVKSGIGGGLLTSQPLGRYPPLVWRLFLIQKVKHCSWICESGSRCIAREQKKC